MSCRDSIYLEKERKEKKKLGPVFLRLRSQRSITQKYLNFSRSNQFAFFAVAVAVAIAIVVALAVLYALFNIIPGTR